MKVCSLCDVIINMEGQWGHYSSHLPSSSMFYTSVNIVWNHQLTFINSSSVTDLNLFPLYWIQKFKQSNPGLTLQPNIRFNVGLTWRTRWPPPCWSPSSSVWSPVGSPRSDSPGLHPPPPHHHHLAGRSPEPPPRESSPSRPHAHRNDPQTQRSFRSFCPDQTSSPAVCSELRAPAPQSLSHTHTHSLQIMIYSCFFIILYFKCILPDVFLVGLYKIYKYIFRLSAFFAD